jgi:hypothetical protein
VKASKLEVMIERLALDKDTPFKQWVTFVDIDGKLHKHPRLKINFFALPYPFFG